MNSVTWETIGYYVAAGGVASVELASDLTTLLIHVLYLGSQVKNEVNIKITCSECAYMTMRRTDDHEGGPSVILEAYLHTHSSLIDDLMAHTLQCKSGALMLEHQLQPVQHLEIIGEICLDVLCQTVVIEADDIEKKV